jgi:hypothetical protein
LIWSVGRGPGVGGWGGFPAWFSTTGSGLGRPHGKLGFIRDLQNPDKDRFELLGKTLAEGGERIVIGMGIGGDNAKANESYVARSILRLEKQPVAHP